MREEALGRPEVGKVSLQEKSSTNGQHLVGKCSSLFPLEWGV